MGVGVKVTLTFDNGPEPTVTPGVLDILGARGIRATFFVLGKKAAMPEGRALIERAVREGHQIGNHTFSHRQLGLISAEEALEEIERCAKALRFLDPPVRLFRPVGGGKLGPHLLQPAVEEKLRRDGYTCVTWNSVPGDWYDPQGWMARALADCRRQDWTLIVLHDNAAAAMSHLDEFLGALESEGCEWSQQFPPDCLPLE